MGIYKLSTPISKSEVEKLKINDIVYLSGEIYCIRDAAHARALEYLKQGKPLPIDLEGAAIFHCGPIVVKKGSNWEVIAAGPTTSSRMEPFEHKLIEKGIKLIIGKGGMGNKTLNTMKKFKAAYGSFTGGAALIPISSIKKVERVEWLELGLPEAIWVLKVENFGPIVITMDSRGKNLHSDVIDRAKKSLPKIYRMLRN
ncbi:MAG: FumA C-terminus/TtdB family hydratase beta subunit [Candidatus Bathyarchaeia archaeon]